MVDRRVFLASVFGSLSYFALHRGERPEGVVRVGTVVDAERVDLERGIEFGAAEANRSATLFGWRVERVALRNPGDHDDVAISALLLAAPGDARRSPRVPVLRLVCDAARADDGSFLLAPCDRGHGDVWQSTLERFGAQQLNDRYRSAMSAAMTSDAWLGWFAFKVVTESVLRVGGTDPLALTEYLSARDTRFDGHKGAALWFDAARRLVQPLYAGSHRGRQ